MKKILLGFALAACIDAATAVDSSQSAPDEYGQFAIDHAPENVEELRAEPDFSSKFSTTFEAFGGDLKAVYAGVPGGGWRLIRYTYKPGLDATRSSPDGAPDNPDPDPPTKPAGNEGATKTNTWSVGNWHYTAHYAYGVRDGVLGWHLDSIDSEYRPSGDKETQQMR